MKKNQGMVTDTPYPPQFSSELLVIEKGEGVWLEDISGKKYLDFGAGIAVNALGYGREDLAQAAYQQMKKLIHISNLYATEPSLQFGQKLIASGPFASVHFGNSGSEANETAIKFARLYALRTKGEGHHKILSFNNAFHGRSLGALSCTPNAKYQDPFKPLLPGMETSVYNDIQALKATLSSEFAAVIVEVIQGEGGLESMTQEFAQSLNSLCAEKNVILIADEVQTGLSRTGSLYASYAIGLKPDIITLAKPLAGGLPLSATLIPEKVNKLIHFAEHGTTFGGGPVTTGLGLLIWEKLSNKSFIQEISEKGEYLKELLIQLKKEFSVLGDIKGKGLLQGIKLKLQKEKLDSFIPAVLTKAREKGLLILRSGADVLRIAPPLIISKQELKKGIEILKQVLNELC